jgi:L-lactate dehydrogenase complex protein LldG
VSAAREEILARIRAAVGPTEAQGAATGRVATPADVDAAYAALPRTYRRAHHDAAGTDIVALFAERAADYRAVVERVSEADLPAAVARVLAGLSRFVVPDGLPPHWLTGLADAAEVADVSDVAGATDVAKASGVAGVAGVARADVTGGDSGGAVGGGRIVRDDPPLSARQLDAVAGVVTGCAVAVAETGTIIMDHGPGQGRRILTLVPDFHLVVVCADQVAADLPDALDRLDPVRPHTLISGPSATSDIELIRVEGVHGPRNLHILVAG